MDKNVEIIKCEVTGIENYGIFVKSEDDYIGLIHISEISKNFVKDIHEFTAIGDQIYCQVVERDEQNKKLKLSIKNIDYKYNGKIIGIIESKRGFTPLKEQLPTWVDEKLNDIEKEQVKS